MKIFSVLFYLFLAFIVLGALYISFGFMNSFVEGQEDCVYAVDRTSALLSMHELNVRKCLDFCRDVKVIVTESPFEGLCGNFKEDYCAERCIQ